MLDLTSNRGKIVEAALRLAESQGWAGLSLDQIANEAGVSLADFRKEFSSKVEILAAYTRSIDDAVLAKVTAADAAIAPRDRLFDVLMTRFELMARHKAGLARIKQDMQYRPGESLAQFGVAARSLYWMLAAAGIDAEGTRGALRLPGIMGIYARVFDIWLEDDDPGLARTMAALDSRLRRGERVMQRIDDIGAAAKRVFSSITAARRSRGTEEAAAEPASGSTPPANGHAPGGGEPGPAPAL